MRKVSGRFFVKKLRKKLLLLLPLAPPQPVMPAKAGIHAFRASSFPTPGTSGQKFFAELFYKKATAFFCFTKGVDGRFRGHDGLRQ
jgi:hypothetical protein